MAVDSPFGPSKLRLNSSSRRAQRETPPRTATDDGPPLHQAARYVAARVGTRDEAPRCHLPAAVPPGIRRTQTRRRPRPPKWWRGTARADRIGSAAGGGLGLEAGENPRTTGDSRAASSEFVRAAADLVGKESA